MRVRPRDGGLRDRRGIRSSPAQRGALLSTFEGFAERRPPAHRDGGRRERCSMVARPNLLSIVMPTQQSPWVAEAWFAPEASGLADREAWDHGTLGHHQCGLSAVASEGWQQGGI